MFKPSTCPENRDRYNAYTCGHCRLVCTGHQHTLSAISGLIWRTIPVVRRDESGVLVAPGASREKAACTRSAAFLVPMYLKCALPKTRMTFRRNKDPIRLSAFTSVPDTFTTEQSIKLSQACACCVGSRTGTSLHRTSLPQFQTSSNSASSSATNRPPVSSDVWTTSCGKSSPRVAGR